MHGKIAMYELMTPDLNKAIDFYASVFGWQFPPMGAMGDRYAIALCGGTLVAGLMKLLPEAEARPRWLLHFEVDDVDQTVALATKLGGKATTPAFDVPGMGRIAFLQDQSGAEFGVVTPRDPDETAEMSLPGVGEFCWRTLMTPEVERSRDFYAQLFGWTISPLDQELLFHGKPIASVTGLTAGYPAPAHWGLAIAIDDIKNTTSKISESGGKVFERHTTVTAIGINTLLKDAEGAVVSDLKPIPRP